MSWMAFGVAATLLENNDFDGFFSEYISFYRELWTDFFLPTFPLFLISIGFTEWYVRKVKLPDWMLGKPDYDEAEEPDEA